MKLQFLRIQTLFKHESKGGQAELVNPLVSEVFVEAAIDRVKELLTLPQGDPFDHS